MFVVLLICTVHVKLRGVGLSSGHAVDNTAVLMDCVTLSLRVPKKLATDCISTCVHNAVSLCFLGCILFAETTHCSTDDH